MQLSDLLDLSRIECDGQATSKKRIFEQLSALIAADQNEISESDIYDCLLARERLGSTGFGHGIALPHGRVAISRAIGAFIHLNQAIGYDANDGLPVDLIFGLLVPREATEEHLQLLGQLATMFSDAQMVALLRTTADAQTLLNHIESWQARQ
jgi:nitrogen PTS system EIIA component